jgi:hypothetical protein
MEALLHFHQIDVKHFEDEACKYISPKKLECTLANLIHLIAKPQNVILEIMEMFIRFLKSLIGIFKSSIYHFFVRTFHNNLSYNICGGTYEKFVFYCILYVI